MANPLAPQGQALENLINYRQNVQGDTNFRNALGDYKGGSDAWWSRYGADSGVGADVLSGAYFLTKPGQITNAEQAQRLNRIRPDVQQALGADPAALSQWMTNHGTNELTKEQIDQVLYGMQAPGQFQFNQKAPGPFQFQGQKPGDFQFNQQQALQNINQMASAIYDPQRAQLDALMGLQQYQYQQQQIETEEDFEKMLRQEEQAFNQRGAFFSSGAIEKQQDLLKEKARSIQGQRMQYLANSAQLMAQKGMLSAQQAQYVQDQLTSRESGAYARWRDSMQDYWREKEFAYSKYRDTKADYYKDREFAYSQYQDKKSDYWRRKEYSMQEQKMAREDYYRERDWLYNTYKDERQFQMDYYQWKKDYKLRKKSSEQ
jgi:hypothetical protein